MSDDRKAKTWKIGDWVSHPEYGTVELVGGTYWSRNGYSNFWSWRKVLEDGSLEKLIRRGYGWA